MKRNPTLKSISLLALILACVLVALPSCGLLWGDGVTTTTTTTTTTTETPTTTKKPDATTATTTTSTTAPDTSDDPVEDENASEGLEFELNFDGESYSVIGIGTCTDEDIVIPSKYEGKPVTEIGEEAFYCVDTMKSIKIPNTVTYIASYAFEDCTGLTELILPDSVTAVGAQAFWYSGIQSLTIGSGVEDLHSSAVLCCESLTEIVVSESNEHYKSVDGNLYSKDGKTFILYAIGKQDTSFAVPDGVEVIGPRALSSSILASVTLPNTLKEIGSEAFHSCEKLENVNVPEGVTSIGLNAFQVCYSLRSISLPASLVTLEGNPFSNCNSLSEITVDEENKSFKIVDGALLSIDGSLLIAYPTGAENTSFTIPSCVTTIGEMAFYGAQKLTRLTISESVTTINDYAFTNCSVLTEITIPENVTYMGGSAFAGCTSLKKAVVNANIEEIPYAMFMSCTTMEILTIPASVKSIDSLVLSACLALAEINFGGTEEQWNAIEKADGWNQGANEFTVIFAGANAEA